MIDPCLLSDRVKMSLRQQLDGTMAGLFSERQSFWLHWSQLAEVLLPRRYRWLVSGNNTNRGANINTAIVDETGLIAARTCASGMLAGMTSPTRPWFRMGLHDLAFVQYGPVKIWLAEVERRMMRVLSESNFYQSLGTLYHDLAVFASAGMIIYEDDDQVIRCYNPCLGEFYFGLSPRLDVDQFYREFVLTNKQAVAQFGIDCVPPDVKIAYMAGGAQRTQELVICHAIEPNTELWENATVPMQYVVPPTFKYREVYWVKGSQGNHIMQMAGYKSKPFVGARWNTTANDAYGYGPGMDALPAVRQLQIEQRRKAEAIDKLVRPPMVASVNMKNEPASILAGAITYAVDVANSGFKPAYQVDPRLAEMKEDIIEVQARVKSVFFVDLFMMISQLDTVRTATEIDARREEKLIQLGPVIERFENEVLDVIIDRVFDIMMRRGLIPEPPPEIAGQEINVQYISMLAEAQRAASTASIERILQVVGNLVGVAPDAMDNIDLDAAIDRYADYLQVDPEIVRSTAQVMDIRAKRQKEKEAQAAAQASMAMVQAGKTLSETDLGGGQSALSKMVA